jgi:hypothetical protein
MKTDELIAALAADAQSVERPIGRTLVLAVVGGAVGAAILFALVLGMRPDVATAVTTLRFDFKFVITLSLLASAFGLVWNLARPGAIPVGWLLALAAVPVLLAIGSVAEMLAVSPADWGQRLAGHNAFMCMILIPMLSAIPFAAALLALRQGAPSHPMLAGAVAGLVAAGIGATLYGTHCPDDSPFFVATWYVIAAGFMAMLGAAIGERFLRW